MSLMPADVDVKSMKQLMPPWMSIPKEFRDFNSRSQWVKLVDTWFFKGLPDNARFVPKDGIDPHKALRHVTTILRSFEPKHEHKTATCAYLLSLWFESVEFPA